MENGQHGRGVALVFDPTKITEVPQSPLIIVKVWYASDLDRQNELTKLLGSWAEITEQLNLADSNLFVASYWAFHVIKLFSLSSKHSGFAEEQEWRVIYDPDRDTRGLLKDYFGYHIGDRGVEPRLKYKIGHIDGVSADDLSLDRMLDRIILGPVLSSALAVRSAERMLEKIGKPQFKSLIRASGIPLRPPSGSSF